MRVGCDIGGTFTDLVAVDADGTVRAGKALNSGQGPRDGVLDALTSTGLRPDAISAFAHGTTTITNLLIERTGARVGLVTTRGFRDVLEIQLSYRQRTFDARYHKTPPLVPRERRLEISGRIDRHGQEREPLDPDELDRVCAQLRDQGVEALAVALYNAYANPVHERAVAAAWERLAPGRPVSCATDVDPRIGEYERTSTTVLNASALPHIRGYAAGLRAALPGEILYLHSAGGVIPGDEARRRPIQLALSGPAGGVLAGRRVAAALGLPRAITLDMGGTSCDVCLIDGDTVRERESFELQWGIPARIRCLDINTVGAGGGSIAWQDAGGALQVGPRSAGALPGPCCYDRGGTEPTVTDANLLLGILDDGGLLGGAVPLNVAAATAALARLGGAFAAGPIEIAGAIHRRVNATMAQAVREITVRHGIDPRACALIAFGGAGPQHGAGVARELADRHRGDPRPWRGPLGARHRRRGAADERHPHAVAAGRGARRARARRHLRRARARRAHTTRRRCDGRRRDRALGRRALPRPMARVCAARRRPGDADGSLRGRSRAPLRHPAR